MVIPSIDTLLADIAKRSMTPVGICKRRVPWKESISEVLQTEIDAKIIDDLMSVLPPEMMAKLLPPDIDKQRESARVALEKARNEQIKNLPLVYAERSGKFNMVTVWDYLGTKSKNYMPTQFNTKFVRVVEPAEGVIRERAALFEFTFMVRRNLGKPVGLAKDISGDTLRPYSFVSKKGWIDVDVWVGPAFKDHAPLPTKMFEQRFDVVFTPDEIEELYLAQPVDK